MKCDNNQVCKIMDKIAFKITEDGSHTLYIKALDETYHSKHGAIQEAMHVFIDAGLNYFNQSELNILEIGFGSGLGFIKTFENLINKKVTMVSYEIEMHQQ